MAAGHTTHTMNLELLKAVATGDANLLAAVFAEQDVLNPLNAVMAIATGDADLLAEVLEEQGSMNFLINGVTAEGSSALHIAASHGYLELVERLCARDTSLVNARNNLLDTPLICAARAGHVDVVNFLINQAPAVQHPVLRARNRYGATAMHEAVRNGHASVLRQLMSKDRELATVVDEQGVSPLYLAVVSNRPDMVDILIGESSDGVRSPASYVGLSGQTALHAAVYANKAQEMSASLKRWNASLVDKTDNSGRTALHYAASLSGKNGVVELLLGENSQNAYITDSDGLFHVHIASISGNISAAHKLMKICLNYDELLDNKRRNILHYAVEHGRMALVWHICRNPKCLRMMNARDGEGNTPLHLAVKHGQAIILIFLMMNHTVDLSVIDNEGLTPLDVASSKIHSDNIMSWFMNTSIVKCLTLCEASRSPFPQATDLTDMWSSEAKKKSSSYAYDNASQINFWLSASVAIISFSAVFVPPGSCTEEGKDDGEKILRFGGRTGCVVFILAIIMSFFTSAAAVVMLFKFDRPARRLRFCTILSSGLVTGAVLFMLIAFAMAVGLILYPGSKWDEYTLFWVVSYLTSGAFIRLVMKFLTSRYLKW